MALENRLKGLILVETLAMQKQSMRANQESTIIKSLGLRREFPQSSASSYQNMYPQFYISKQSSPVQDSVWVHVGYSPLEINS